MAVAAPMDWFFETDRPALGFWSLPGKEIPMTFEEQTRKRIYFIMLEVLNPWQSTRNNSR